MRFAEEISAAVMKLPLAVVKMTAEEETGTAAAAEGTTGERTEEMKEETAEEMTAAAVMMAEEGVFLPCLLLEEILMAIPVAVIFRKITDSRRTTYPWEEWIDRKCFLLSGAV